MARTGRPTTYRGIQMRSRLEADYAAWMDKQGSPWQYEPKCFASPAGQWLPDFAVGQPPPGHYVEIKPYLRSWEEAGPVPNFTGWLEFLATTEDLIPRMAGAWESEPDAELTIIFWRYGRGIVDALMVGAHPDDKVWTFNFGHGLYGILPSEDQYGRLSIASGQAWGAA